MLAGCLAQCPIGYTCAGGTASRVLCATAGRYCPAAASVALLCRAGSYGTVASAATAASSDCAGPCVGDAGRYCPPGSTSTGGACLGREHTHACCMVPIFKLMNCLSRSSARRMPREATLVCFAFVEFVWFDGIACAPNCFAPSLTRAVVCCCRCPVCTRTSVSWWQRSTHQLRCRTRGILSSGVE